MGAHFPERGRALEGRGQPASSWTRWRAWSAQRGYARRRTWTSPSSRRRRALAPARRRHARATCAQPCAWTPRRRVGEGQEHRRPGRHRPRRRHRRPGRRPARSGTDAREWTKIGAHEPDLRHQPRLEALTAGTPPLRPPARRQGPAQPAASPRPSRRASQLGIPLRFETRETLDRMAGGIPHQGLIAVVSAKPVIDAREAAGAARARRRCSWCSTASRTRATWARSCARRRRRAPTACCCPSATARASRRR